MNLSNIKISRKLGAGFGAVLALLVLLTAIACQRFEQVSDQLDKVFLDRDPKIGHLRAIKDALNDTTVDMGNMILQADPQARVAAERSMAEDTAIISAALKQLDATIQAPQARALFEQLTTRREQFLVQRKAFLALAEQGERDKALALLLNEVRNSQKDYVTALGKLDAFQTELRNMDRATADQLADSGAKVMLCIALAALALAALVAWVITRSITVPLAAAAATARRVAAGDLSDHPCRTGKDETGQLLAALQHMTIQLRAIVGQVRSGSSGIARAAGEIATGNLDLSNRTEQQAGALEETASSMEEMTAAVRQNLDHARHANQLAAGASDAARRGGEVVGQVVQTMANISTAAHQINDIIGVIDSIAFQTNILALNAAVEAARAGEQGRGFAVVASEVRNLAQRSATAAKDIKQLIGNADQQVAQGSKLVEQAGEEMHGIMQQIVSVSDVMREIVAASEEQGSGIAQINDAIMQMDQVTQQNAALVEQSAAAAASMREQSEQLVDAVAVFQLDDGARPATPRPPASRARPHAVAPRLALA